MNTSDENTTTLKSQIFGWFILAVSSFCLMSLINFTSDPYVDEIDLQNRCGKFGLLISSGLLYALGALAYPFTLWLLYIGYRFCIQKNNISKKKIIVSILFICNLALILSIVSFHWQSISRSLRHWSYVREVKILSLYPYIETKYCLGGWIFYSILSQTDPCLHQIFGYKGTLIILCSSITGLISILLENKKHYFSINRMSLDNVAKRNILTSLNSASLKSIKSSSVILNKYLNKKDIEETLNEEFNTEISDELEAIHDHEIINQDSNQINDNDIDKETLFSEIKVTPSDFLFSERIDDTISEAFTKIMNIDNLSNKSLDIVYDNSYNEEAIDTQASIIVDTLSTFAIEGSISNIYTGSSFSLFELQLPPGIRVNKVKQLSDNLALRLKKESVRIICPVPGTDAMGVEVPNIKTRPINFFDILLDFISQNPVIKHKMPALLGKTVYGEVVVFDIAQMPHVLMAGSTGSGKSVCINTILSSIILLMPPEKIRLILIDPKMVELSYYENAHHLLCDIITDSKEAALALKWLAEEMDRRYAILMSCCNRNIESYNLNNPDKYMPRILCVIDEFNDLLMTSETDKNIEMLIVRLAQKSRAVGMHIILATQRPSREVVTGLIKTNFPARIAFRVSNRFDSQIIIDEAGAECLTGKGDMFFIDPQSSQLIRLQGCYISESDVLECVNESTKKFNKLKKICHKFSEIFVESNDTYPLDDEDDPLIYKAVELAKEQGYVSATLLQRYLKIGYPKAAGIVESMTRKGIVSMPNKQRVREYIGGSNSSFE